MAIAVGVLILALLVLAAARAFSADVPTIVIDPGHPSEVSDGATRLHGTTEVHEAWEIALLLRTLLEQSGLRVVLTKSRERELVRNRTRAEIANRANATLMVRLHCDAAAGSGFALYHPDRKGHTQGVTGPDERILAESGRAAREMHDGMAPVLAGRLHDNGVKGDSKTFVGGKQGALTGSIFSRVPVVTVEMVVLTNPSDAALIRTPYGEALMARALARGVLAYLDARRAHPRAQTSPGRVSPQPRATSAP
jgi:N-acetylmuramoyl-L-alanine amidase